MMEIYVPIRDRQYEVVFYVRGESFGQFAVHPFIDEDEGPLDDGWTVTHIPTGIAILQDIPRRDAAVDLAKRLPGRANYNRLFAEWLETRIRPAHPKPLLQTVQKWMRDHHIRRLVG